MVRIRIRIRIRIRSGQVKRAESSYISHVLYNRHAFEKGIVNLGVKKKVCT